MFENLLENFNTNTSQYYSSSQKSNDMSNLDENGYNISSMKNIDSSLEKELRLLHALYKRTLKNVLNVNLDFNNLSKEEICVINSCEATLYQYYDGYELKLATSTSINIHPPKKYITYTDEGYIDPFYSERLPVTVDWCCVAGFITFKCIKPFKALKEFALLNPFFLYMNNDELDEHLKDLLDKNA